MSRRKVLLAAALVAAVCYAGTLANGFVFDDDSIVTGNPLVTGEHLPVIDIFTSHYWAHVRPEGNLYRPLPVLSYALEHRLFGLSPIPYHAANVLLHAVCSALVAALALALGLPAGAALAAGVLFAAHPIHTEAVAYVVGRADLMATAAVLGAWLLHLGARRAGTWRLATILLLYGVGLLSKESAVVLPGLMLAGDVWRTRRGETRWRETLPATLACFGLMAVWLLGRVWLLPAPGPGALSESIPASAPAALRIGTALTVLPRYLWLMIWPARLSADYSYNQIPTVASLAAPAAIAGLLLYAGIALWGLVGLLAGRSPRLDGLCAVVWLTALSPVSNIIVPMGTVMAERLVYLPSVAFCLVLPALWVRYGAGRGLGIILAALLAVGYAGRTMVRVADWKDDMTLFAATTATSPASAKAHYNLGVALAAADRTDEALAEYLTAIRIRDDDPAPHRNAGLLLARMGRYAEALPHLEKAVRYNPVPPEALVGLGVVCTQLGRPVDAERAFRAALADGSASPETRRDAAYDLGTLLLTAGRVTEAIEPLVEARDLGPDDADLRYQLGLAMLEAGRPSGAIPELQAALHLAPDLTDAHLQLARAFLAAGDPARAEAEARSALSAGRELTPSLRQLLDERGAPGEAKHR